MFKAYAMATFVVLVSSAIIEGMFSEFSGLKTNERSSMSDSTVSARADNAPSSSHGSPVMALGSAAACQAASPVGADAAAIREMAACISAEKKQRGKSRARCGGVTGYEIRHLPIRSFPRPLPYPVTHIPLRIRSKDHISSGCLKFRINQVR